MFNYLKTILTICVLVSIIQLINCTIGGCHDDPADSTSIAACTGPANAFCQITFAAGSITSKGCAETCTPSATQACCDSNDCNTATEFKTCLQCDTKETCSEVYEGTACSEESVACFTEYDLADGQAQARGCTNSLYENANNLEYCMEDDCNSFESLLKCILCANEADCESAETVHVCQNYLFESCKTEFNANGSAIKKSCSDDCYNDAYTSCCDEEGCNTAKTSSFTCYQCDDMASCDEATEPTPCPQENQNACVTYLEDGVPISKSCIVESACENGEADGTTTSCCSEDGCNDETSSATRLFSTNLFAALLISIFISFY